MVRLKYVNKDHSHRLYHQEGICLVRPRGKGPKNQLIKFDSGELVVCPWGNLRKAEPGRSDCLLVKESDKS